MIVDSCRRPRCHHPMVERSTPRCHHNSRGSVPGTPASPIDCFSEGLFRAAGSHSASKAEASWPPMFCLCGLFCGSRWPSSISDRLLAQAADRHVQRRPTTAPLSNPISEARPQTMSEALHKLRKRHSKNHQRHGLAVPAFPQASKSPAPTPGRQAIVGSEIFILIRRLICISIDHPESLSEETLENHRQSRRARKLSPVVSSLAESRQWRTASDALEITTRFSQPQVATTPASCSRSRPDRVHEANRERIILTARILICLTAS